MIGIYKITNQINGKIYVGQSVDIKRRWQEHRRKWKSSAETCELYKSIREFGIENFFFEVIEECEIEELNKKEKYWINYYNSFDNGYNMSTIENLQRRISTSVVKEIQEKLQNTNITNSKMAEEYKVSHTWISLVNQGKLWYNEGLSYPLRPIQCYKHEQRYCPDCGKPILYESKHCPKCSHLVARKYKRPNREELKKMIREIPLEQIAKRFGASSNTIRKWCDYYNLPRLKREINSYSDEEWELI